jgi:hypothetical protein
MKIKVNVVNLVFSITLSLVKPFTYIKGDINRKMILRSLVWSVNTKIIWKIYFYKVMVWLRRISDVVLETVVYFVTTCK